MKTIHLINSAVTRRTLILTVALSAGLAGCATEQRCPLNSKDGYCSSVSETHEAALDDNDPTGGENVLEYKGIPHDGDSDDKPAHKHKGNGGDGNAPPPVAPPAVPLSVGHLQGPLFVPAKPYRYWVAPWTDSNGIVHGGEMQYFVLPGHFLYGGLEAPGNASAVMSPLSPDALGFKPVKTPASQKTEVVGPRQTFGSAPEAK